MIILHNTVFCLQYLIQLLLPWHGIYFMFWKYKLSTTTLNLFYWHLQNFPQIHYFKVSFMLKTSEIQYDYLRGFPRRLQIYAAWPPIPHISSQYRVYVQEQLHLVPCNKELAEYIYKGILYVQRHSLWQHPGIVWSVGHMGSNMSLPPSQHQYG